MSTDKNLGLKTQVLDCTLRDGGYYCDWDFKESTVRSYLQAVTKSGVKYVEIGFRSPFREGSAGKFKFSSDELIEDLQLSESLNIAVMIDGKDFVVEGKVAIDDLARMFVRQSNSRVDLVRITATPTIMPCVVDIAGQLKEQGYTVSVNLMQASILSDQAIAEAAKALELSAAEVMYLADSFGGLDPTRTRRLFEIVSKHFSGLTGFHGHDNLGLALANGIAAIEADVDLIDSSIRGMGRGPGNLRTEQLLLYMKFHLERNDLDVTPLFEIVSSDFGELHERYQWGMSLPYMLSGVYDIHPMYAQRLLQGVRYSPLEVIHTLESLHRAGSGSRFSTQGLTTALRDRFAAINSPVLVKDLAGFKPGLPDSGPDKTRPLLLLASGPSVDEHSKAINDFIHKLNPVVVECNAHENIEQGIDHYNVFTNSRRLEQFVPLVNRQRQRVVLVMPTIDASVADLLQDKEIYSYPCEVREGMFEASDEGCVIPHDVVAMAALALCNQICSGTIFLCGVDGYQLSRNGSDLVESDERAMLDREMETFFTLFKESEVSSLKNVISLTPTAFDLETKSIYSYL